MNIFQYAIETAKNLQPEENNLFKPASGLNIEYKRQGFYQFHNVSGFKGEIKRTAYYDENDIERFNWIVEIYDHDGDTIEYSLFHEQKFQDARLFASMFEG